MNNHYKPVVKSAHTVFQLNFPLFVILITPFFKPGSLEYIAPLVDTLFEYWLAIVSVVIGFLYLAYGRMSKMMLAIIAFEATLTLSTILNAGDYYGLVVDIVRTIPFCMLIEIGIKQNPKELIKALAAVLGTECLINSITILAFPNGMYENDSIIGWYHTENYFLAYDNIHIMYLLPFLTNLWLYRTYRKKSAALTAVWMLLFSATVYVTWSATSVVVITVFLIIFLFSEFRLMKKIIELKKYLVLIIAAFVGIILLRRQEFFANFIVDFLGKDLTLSGRTDIWDNALYWFEKHPIFGNGIQTIEVVYRAIGAPHAHNYILQILYQSGIMGLVCFAVILFLLFKPLRHAKGKEYGYILSAALFIYLVLFQVEVYISVMMGFWGSVVMAYNIKPLTEGLSRQNDSVSRRRRVLWRRNNTRQIAIPSKHGST